MVLEVKIQLTHDGCPFIELSKELDGLQFNTHCNDYFDLLMFPGKITPKIFQKVDKVFSNGTFQVVQGSNNKSSYILMDCYFRSSTHIPGDIVGSNNGLRIGPISFYKGTEVFSFICFTESDLKAILKGFEEYGFDHKLLSNREMSTTNFINKIDTQGIPVSEFLSSLTENQLKILTIAHTLGYYEIPRSVKLAEIADEFGVTRHSIEKTLRRAENKIMNTLVPLLNYQFSTGNETIPSWFCQMSSIHSLKS